MRGKVRFGELKPCQGVFARDFRLFQFCLKVGERVGGKDLSFGEFDLAFFDGRFCA